MIRPAIIAISFLLAALPVVAGDTCRTVQADSWLRERPQADGASYVPIENEARVVEINETQALEMLSADAVVELTNADVAEFLGPTVRPQPRGLRPYLVRAVMANPGGRLIGVERNGDSLLVTSGSLGCPGYVRRAVIAYLDRKPAEVFVVAMTAD